MTLMRLLFLLLVLANVVFFAYARFAGEPGARDPGAVARQMEADKIRVLTPEQMAARTRSGPAASGDRSCIEWGAFSPGDFGAARAVAETIARGTEFTERRVGPPTGWWVYVPPLETRGAANTRLADLKRQGIEDVSIVVEDPKYANGLSLGVFASEDAAAKRLAEVRKRGVKAEMGAREASSQRLYLRFLDAPAELRARLAEQRIAFPTADVTDCPKV
jgi:hypothetical protein